MRSKEKRRPRILYAVLALLPLAIALALLSQTALATTYTITDGDRVVTYTTFATDPAQVLGEAGLELSEGDTYTTDAAMGTACITINRNRKAHIWYYGEYMTASVSGETVGELLHRLNLDPEPRDRVNQEPDAPVTDGMEIRIDKVVTRRETYTKTVPFAVEQYSKSTLPLGATEILVKGVEGELKCEAEVTYVNGQEQSRRILEEIQTVAPVTELVALGTGEDQPRNSDRPIIGDGYILLPTGEVLTYTKKDYVRATAYTHTDKGCDLITSTGSTVRRGTVAVDPRYIPYGTRMFIISNDGEVVYGLCAAEDCGGAIKGDRVDLYYPTYQECMAFGRRSCTVYFLG